MKLLTGTLATGEGRQGRGRGPKFPALRPIVMAGLDPASTRLPTIEASFEGVIGWAALAPIEREAHEAKSGEKKRPGSGFGYAGAEA
jgi:hypothetical protein